MKAILRATAMLCGSSGVSILAGVCSVKVAAVILGPAGYGILGILQNLLAFAVLVGGLGINQALVREGASAATQSDHDTLDVLRRAAERLFWIPALAVAGLLVICRHALTSFLLPSASCAAYIPSLAIALVLTVATTIQTGTLNACHRVSALAALSLASSVVSAVGGTVVLYVWRASGIPAVLLVNAVASWAISTMLLRRHVKPVESKPSRRQVLSAMQSLLRFGVPFTLSMLVGAAVQLALPVFILHRLGSDGTGFYRAAATVSVSYLGFIPAAMAQDYYPRVAAASSQHDSLVKMVNEQHRVVMMLGVPLILGCLTLAPYFVPVIYSPHFAPAVRLLQWQLIADVLKYSSWPMSYVILARSGSGRFLLTELIAGGSNLAISWFAMQWFGLAGVGIAFLLSYGVYYATVFAILRCEIGFAWTADNTKLLFVALCCATAVMYLSYRGPNVLTIAIAGVIVASAVTRSLLFLRRELTTTGEVVAN